MTYRKHHLKRKLKTKNKIIKSPVFWISLGGLIIIIVILYFILFFPKIQVKNIEISGNQKVNSLDVQNLAWSDLQRKIVGAGIFNISSKSILVVDTANLTKDILAKFPEIETIEIQKKLPETINIKIKERIPFAAFCQNKECFLMDVNGVIFESLQTVPQNMVVVHNESSDQVFVGENIVQKNIIDAISKIQKDLKNNFQIDIKEALVSNPLVFKTSENWQVYFDTNSDIDLQVMKMNALLQSEISANARKNLQYIYLQYKDRAYYK